MIIFWGKTQWRCRGKIWHSRVTTWRSGQERLHEIQEDCCQIHGSFRQYYQYCNPKMNHRIFFQDDIRQVKKSDFHGIYSQATSKLSTAGRLQVISGYLEYFLAPESNALLVKGDLIYILNQMVPDQWHRSMIGINFQLFNENIILSFSTWRNWRFSRPPQSNQVPSTK